MSTAAARYKFPQRILKQHDCFQPLTATSKTLLLTFFSSHYINLLSLRFTYFNQNYLAPPSLYSSNSLPCIFLLKSHNIKSLKPSSTSNYKKAPCHFESEELLCAPEFPEPLGTGAISFSCSAQQRAKRGILNILEIIQVPANAAKKVSRGHLCLFQFD